MCWADPCKLTNGLHGRLQHTFSITSTPLALSSLESAALRHFRSVGPRSRVYISRSTRLSSSFPSPSPSEGECERARPCGGARLLLRSLRYAAYAHVHCSILGATWGSYTNCTAIRITYPSQGGTRRTSLNAMPAAMPTTATTTYIPGLGMAGR